MTESSLSLPSSPTDRIRSLLASQGFQRTIIALIVLNGIVLGLHTSARAMEAAGPLLVLIDRVLLAVFVVELVLKLAVQRARFAADPWNIFDFVVVAISLVPSGGGLSVLRALRILRILRLVSVVPQMRRVVGAMLSALPGMGSIVLVLMLIYYVAGVLATRLFGAAFQEWFGTIGASMYSLFQIMTLESWSMGIVRPVMEVYPWAWAFFVPYITITTFCALNLFIALIVSAMQQAAIDEAPPAPDTAGEIAGLRQEIAELKTLLTARAEAR